MNINQKLEALGKIQKVEAPEFLLTRIIEKIKSSEEVVLPAAWKWSFTLVSIFVLLMNILGFVKYADSNKSQGAEMMINAMHLKTSNDLYD